MALGLWLLWEKGREQLNSKLHKAYAELSAWEDKEKDAAHQHQQLDDRLQEKQGTWRLRRIMSLVWLRMGADTPSVCVCLVVVLQRRSTG